MSVVSADKHTLLCQCWHSIYK